MIVDFRILNLQISNGSNSAEITRKQSVALVPLVPRVLVQLATIVPLMRPASTTTRAPRTA